MAKIVHTFNSYLEKPMEKGTSAFQLKAVQKELDYKYKNLDARIKIKIENVCTHGGSYYVHYKIPSENVDKINTYDVILQFTAKNMMISSESTVKNYNIKFFSNSPGFMYTFGYVYKLDGLFIDELASKYPDKIFSMKPVVKNPYKIVNYDKTIYFAMMSFKASSVHFNKGYLDSKSTTTYSKMMKSVRSAATIKKEIITENNRVKREKNQLKNQLKDPAKLIDDRKKNAKTSVGKHSVVNKPITSKSSTSGSKSPVKNSVSKITASRKVKR